MVYVQCTSIKLQLKLTQKKGVQHRISNWTKHVTPCYLKRLKADSGQAKLTLKPIQLDSSNECSSSQSHLLDPFVVDLVDFGGV